MLAISASWRSLRARSCRAALSRPSRSASACRASMQRGQSFSPGMVGAPATRHAVYGPCVGQVSATRTAPVSSVVVSTSAEALDGGSELGGEFVVGCSMVGFPLQVVRGARALIAPGATSGGTAVGGVVAPFIANSSKSGWTSGSSSRPTSRSAFVAITRASCSAVKSSRISATSSSSPGWARSDPIARSALQAFTSSADCVAVSAARVDGGASNPVWPSITTTGFGGGSAGSSSRSRAPGERRKLLEDEEEAEAPSPCRALGGTLGASPKPPFGGVLGGSKGSVLNRVPLPRMVRTYSSRTIRGEYQIGPGCTSTSTTGSPRPPACLGRYTIGSHGPLAQPYITPCATSSLSNFIGAPSACAIAFNGCRSTPYSVLSCINPITSIHTPRAPQLQKRSFWFFFQSPK